MTKKFRQLSLQAKMSSIFILVNLVVFAVTVILILGINSMSSEIDMVYQGNLRLNELSDALTAVQDSMTEYLDSKTSDSLEEFYRSEQIYAQMVQGLSDDVTEATFRRMERSIRHMSEEYLDLVGQTIEAKRGRNVEKYRVRYENATQMYEYINTYIYSLNNEQFRSNSENYSRLSVAFRSFELFSVITLTIVAVISVAIVVKLTGEIISPLKRLTVMANEVAGENFDTELLPVQSEDEIGVVTGAFNQMVISIRQYLERLRQSMEIQRSLMEKELLMESHLKDAQLKYLQAQINPHFLFNTLNAGAQLAMMEGADRTYDYIQNVADFFRYNVKKGNDIVTLREELELIDHYIYILNVRFSGDIHYEKEISEDLLDCAVPSMILQPIVENCVNHGIREMSGEGRIWLKVYHGEEDTLVISIRDNGIGMDAEIIEKLRNGTYHEERQSSGSNGIAMGNVIARLKLFTQNEDGTYTITAGEGGLALKAAHAELPAPEPDPEPTPDPDTPDTPVSPEDPTTPPVQDATPDDAETPVNPENPTNPPVQDATPDSTVAALPKTGVNWFTALAMALSGMALTVAGAFTSLFAKSKH